MAPRDNRPAVSYHDGQGMPDPGFYSHAVSLDQARRQVYTSGIVGQRADGSFSEDFNEQIQAAYTNLKAALKSAGATPRDLVKVTFFVVGFSLDRARQVFEPFFQFLADDYGMKARPANMLIPVPSLALPVLKVEIEAVAAIGGNVTPYADSISRSLERPITPSKVDVLVIGAGFSGLQAAWDLQKAGIECVVLEAKHRVGGRSRSHKLQSGPGVVDLGAGWINSTTQEKVYATAQRLGLQVVKQRTEGNDVLQLADGTVIKSDSKNVTELEQASIAKLIECVDGGAENIDIRKPEAFSPELDKSWKEYAQTTTPDDVVGANLLEFISQGTVARDADEVSMHYVLDYIKSAGGYVSISSEEEGGAQSLKIKQGTSAIATGLADELKSGSVLLNCPVDSVRQSGEGALAQTATGLQFSARKVILTVPTHTYRHIHFTPPLPHAKRALVSRTKPGIAVKTILTYSTPWWREAGYSGKFTSFQGPIQFAFDASVEEHEQYSIAVLTGGTMATEWAKLNELQRQEAMIEHLTALVDADYIAQARDVIEFNYINWADEAWIEGAPTSATPPGILAKHGSSLREPFQCVHFGGTELAFEYKGFLEGALRSGSRVADEVIEWAKNAKNTNGV